MPIAGFSHCDEKIVNVNCWVPDIEAMEQADNAYLQAFYALQSLQSSRTVLLCKELETLGVFVSNTI